jgi:predicted nuclease of predicted toxin-antitoxin system
MNAPAQRSLNGCKARDTKLSPFSKKLKVSMMKTILIKAVPESWIVITNDKDFGEMIFRERREHRGVIFLRLADERTANKIAVLRHLLENYSDKLENQFATVTETKARFA